MNTNEFLRAFFPDENEPIYFRAFKPKDAPDTESNRPQNYSASRKTLARVGGEIELKKINHLRGVYFAPNAGGNSDTDITRFNVVFVERDDLPIEEQHRILDSCPLAASIRVETKKSVHAYFLLKENCAADEWSDVQNRLIAFVDGDKSIKNPSRLMRLPFYMHLTYNKQATGNYDSKPVELVQFNPERRYSIGELKAAFPAAEKSKTYSANGLCASETINELSLNKTLLFISRNFAAQGTWRK